MQSSDVLVVGKGNAALCAALAARDRGTRVTMLKAASQGESGGKRICKAGRQVVERSVYVVE
jgi:succinate dehydrogenase/fumarate reductase flavoprotein subunit